PFLLSMLMYSYPLSAIPLRFLCGASSLMLLAPSVDLSALLQVLHLVVRYTPSGGTLPVTEREGVADAVTRRAQPGRQLHQRALAVILGVRADLSALDVFCHKGKGLAHEVERTRPSRLFIRRHLVKRGFLERPQQAPDKDKVTLRSRFLLCKVVPV